MSATGDHLVTTRLTLGGVIEVSYDGTVWMEEGPTGVTGDWGKWWENSAAVGKYMSEGTAVNDLIWRTYAWKK